MEFLIKTDLKTIPEKIDFNFEEMKAELSEKLAAYNALVVTEDSIKSAKADKANLNKLRTAVEDKRKEIKKLCLAPYEVFEKQCKEIVALIDQPIKSIDGQIAVFDQKLQDEKWEQISGYYKAEVKELISVVPLEKIVSPKWKNKTESLETVCNGIGDTLDRIRTENDNFEKSIDTSVDLNYVYSVAVNELGMVHVGQDNIIQYEKTESEYVRQYEDIPTWE